MARVRYQQEDHNCNLNFITENITKCVFGEKSTAEEKTPLLCTKGPETNGPLRVQPFPSIENKSPEPAVKAKIFAPSARCFMVKPQELKTTESFTENPFSPFMTVPPFFIEMGALRRLSLSQIRTELNKKLLKRDHLDMKNRKKACKKDKRTTIYMHAVLRHMYYSKVQKYMNYCFECRKGSNLYMADAKDQKEGCLQTDVCLYCDAPGIDVHVNWTCAFNALNFKSKATKYWKYL